MIKTILARVKEPELKGLDIDDPNTIEIHKRIIQRKPLLVEAYSSFYREFLNAHKKFSEGHFVEIGSGAGFIKKFIPSVITTDIMELPHVDKVFSAEDIKFEDSSVSSFFLLHSFHHIKNPHKFLYEAQRCLKPGGLILMIEPSNTIFSRFIRKCLGHEPYNEKASWEVEGYNPMSDANLALSWIVFVRDYHIFKEEFPKLSLNRYEPHTPFKFLLSGGINYKSLIPKSLTYIIIFLDKMLYPLNKFLGMHVTIEIEKKK